MNIHKMKEKKKYERTRNKQKKKKHLKWGYIFNSMSVNYTGTVFRLEF